MMSAENLAIAATTTSTLGIWLTFTAAVIAAAVAVLNIFYVRRTGRDTAKAAQNSADAANKSAEAAERAAAASTKSANAADRAVGQLEARSKREETMRTLRWAAELAVGSEDKTQLGLAQLLALADSDLLDVAQQGFIDAALQAVVKPVVEEITRISDGLTLTDQVTATLTTSGRVDVQSQQPTKEGDAR